MPLFPKTDLQSEACAAELDCIRASHTNTQWMKDPSAILLILHVFREIRKLLKATSKKNQWIPKKKLLREA